jgi:type I restriction enzyme S subunit
MKTGWKKIKLRDVLVKTETTDPTRSPTTEFDYIDVSSVSNETLTIQETQRLKGKDAPSRARRLVRANDVLFATIRPTLRRIAVVPEELDQQVCSTGYFVLRAKPEVDFRFVFYFLQTEDFMEAMEKLQKGASYPAVTDGDVRSQPIPLPPLSEQQRIVGVLDEAFAGLATAEAHAAQNLQNARALFESHLQAVFTQRGPGWVEKSVKELAAPFKGSIRTGPFGSQLLHSEFVDAGIAVLGIDNAVANEFRWGKRRFITPEKYRQLERYTVRPGDVLITIMGTCGRCAIVPDDIPTAINTKHICCITLDRKQCLPSYLHIYFLHAPQSQQFLAKHAKGAIMAGLNMGLIQELPVFLPPIKIQVAITEAANALSAETQRLADLYERKRAALEALKRSLLHQAFAGEL